MFPCSYTHAVGHTHARLELQPLHTALKLFSSRESLIHVRFSMRWHWWAINKIPCNTLLSDLNLLCLDSTSDNIVCRCLYVTQCSTPMHVTFPRYRFLCSPPASNCAVGNWGPSDAPCIRYVRVTSDRFCPPHHNSG